MVFSDVYCHPYRKRHFMDERPGALSVPAFTRCSRVDRLCHFAHSSLKIKYQLAKIVTTQPAIPAKNTTSKMRMIPISMRVSMCKQDYTRAPGDRTPAAFNL